LFEILEKFFEFSTIISKALDDKLVEVTDFSNISCDILMFSL
jgi:hypothetical protein